MCLRLSHYYVDLVHGGRRKATIWCLSVCLVFFSNVNAVIRRAPW